MPAYYLYDAPPVLSLYYQASRTVLTLYYQLAASDQDGCFSSVKSPKFYLSISANIPFLFQWVTPECNDIWRRVLFWGLGGPFQPALD